MKKLEDKFWLAMNKPTIDLSVKECAIICEKEIVKAFNAAREEQTRVGHADPLYVQPKFGDVEHYLETVNE